jgi:cell division protein FtsX
MIIFSVYEILVIAGGLIGIGVVIGWFTSV